jgi:ubiquinone biosynthesis protein COQ9
MAKSTFANENSKISAAALRAAAAYGWDKITLDVVAKNARLSLRALQKRFATTNDLVPVIAAEIDKIAFVAFRPVSGTPHDILFDLLMARFDVLQKHRVAILSMLENAQHDCSLGRVLACATLDGIYRVIDIAKLDRPSRPALVAGIGAVYGWAFVAWRKDASHDMTKTMAALDRALRYADKATQFLASHA